MRKYENLVIVRPTLTAEEIQESLAKIHEIITSNGGEIATTDDMGIRKLAYPINKQERGFFQVIYYSAQPSAIAEIERRFRINEELLRFVTIKYDTNREVAAWNDMVKKAQNKSNAPKTQAIAEESTEAQETASAE